MQLTTLKQRVLEYTQHLTTYDYIAYGWLLAVLLGFLLMAMVLAGKKPKTSTFFILMVLLFMFVGPFVLKYGMDNIIRKAIIVDQNITELPFSKNLIVLGTVQNQGRVDFDICRVSVNVVKEDSNKYKQFLYTLKPLRKKTLAINKSIIKGESMHYKVVFNHFSYQKPYHVDQSVECY